MSGLPSLPRPLSSFIGRDEIVADVISALRRPDMRLLTVTGPGGVGKTRLAIRAGEAMHPAFKGGVGFIPLGAIEDPARVLPTIAAALGMHEGDSRSLLARVRAHLGRHRCLLVLDNFEQVTDAVPVLTHILESCPAVSILVTSRTVLRVSGEHVFPIPPMSFEPECPSPDTIPPDDPEDGASEAVRLFVDRASAVSPNISLDWANAPVIAYICARLDGLPLAIELAASRSNVLAPPDMLDQLDHRLPLLASGPRDQPERLQTMRNAIAWSYDLLCENERALFRCLTVFVGGFTLKAAAAICGRSAGDILDGLAGLVDQSLIRVVTESIDEQRFTILETIREFGLGELAAAGDMDRVQSLHARYYLALASRIDSEVDDPEASTCSRDSILTGRTCARRWRDCSIRVTPRKRCA